MKNTVKVLYFLFSIAFLGYLFFPTPEFPTPAPDFLQSKEPADTETILRRSYFTNLTRDEVVSYYEAKLDKSTFFNFSLPTYRLNYPPEEAKILIRDQTRSTFLEEIVHPLRGSLFVNGFKPNEKKDAIFIEGKTWVQKITVRYVPSTLFTRVVVGFLTLFLMAIVYRGFISSLNDLVVQLRKAKIWTFR